MASSWVRGDTTLEGAMSRVMGGTRVNGGGGGSPSNEHDPLVTGDTQHLEDLEGGPGSGSPLGIDMQTGAAPALDNRETNSSLASFTRWMEQNVPFLVLLAFVFIYEHWRGILAFAWLTSGLHFANTHMREQVGLKEKRQTGVLAGVAAGLLAASAGTMLVFSSEQLWLHLVLLVPSPEQGAAKDLLGMLWRIVMADLVVRYLSMACKVLGTLCICSCSHRRPRRCYQLTEMLVSLYRTVLPIPHWYRWLLGKGPSSFVASLATGLYLTFKLAAAVDQLRSVSGMFVAVVTRQALYGRYATEDEVRASGDDSCSICHDDVSNPVVLGCKHIFCEDCVCEWLERERTCPLCRAPVSTGPRYQSDGTTPLMCQVF